MLRASSRWGLRLVQPTCAAAWPIALSFLTSPRQDRMAASSPVMRWIQCITSLTPACGARAVQPYVAEANVLVKANAVQEMRRRLEGPKSAALVKTFRARADWKSSCCVWLEPNRWMRATSALPRGQQTTHHGYGTQASRPEALGYDTRPPKREDALERVSTPAALPRR
ncbi:hypothetical protein PHYSODRAFT_298903 [Phytophthora sojae]|uniref:Uncharacterized protein n=1 Tax=Phytophthora sojae (strain P6497) TaxID=1094619 RepID=G4Z667_PHYSP|nr:hypothetical protein PHYSODRAFT_298903 [Phytophthora sojae]EGZ20986.1 hypothetical protein PHYSODRAFT_298903 [Phytophthora sojae]|eukprot:XP_009523703.1 hypothetical protein PHYSODRAFT_298903 [Phytophthora sojae]